MKSYIKEFGERPGYFSETLFFERFHGDSAGPILEVGCSVGHMMRYGAEKKVGIDYDLDALVIARKKGYAVVQCDIQHGLCFDDNTFSSIDCQHVIEHVENPLFVMKECLRVLKPGGKAIIVTPNVQSLGFEFYVDYTHIRPFTKTSLERIAYDAGFSRFTVEYMYTGLPMTKLLHRKGLLSVQTALWVQTMCHRLGMRIKDTLILVAQK